MLGSRIKQGIASELRTIFDLIVKMSLLNESFHVIALNEYEARKQYKEKDFDEITEVCFTFLLLIRNMIMEWVFWIQNLKGRVDEDRREWEKKISNRSEAENQVDQESNFVDEDHI